MDEAEANEPSQVDTRGKMHSGYPCDRFCFKKDLELINATFAAFVLIHFPDENVVHLSFAITVSNLVKQVAFLR